MRAAEIFLPPAALSGSAKLQGMPGGMIILAVRVP